MTGRFLWRSGSAVVLALIALTVFVPAPSLYAQDPIRFNRTWWNSLDKDQHWDFIYGFTDCGSPVHSDLNMAQYEDFVTSHVSSEPDSALRLIRLAPYRVKASQHAAGGEVWSGRHGFNDGDLWGDNVDEGRAWVEGYMACEGRPVTVAAADHYVRLLLRHYSDSKRHADKLADVLEPLLPTTPSRSPE